MPTVRNVHIEVLLLLACATLAAAPAIAATEDTAATNTPQAPAVPTYSTLVRQVVLDVVVTDKHGHSVKGLHASDFVLSEDGVRQTVTSVLERDALSSPTPVPALPPNTFADHPPITNAVEMTAIVFDTYDIDWPSGYYARYEVAQYLNTVKPGTPLAVFKLDPYGLQVIQDFTTNADDLKKAVESNRNAQWPKFLPVYTAPFIRTAALHEVARYLSSFSGRKNLIWFGGGVGLLSGRNDLPDVDTFAQDIEGITDTLRLNGVALYQVDPRGVIMDPNEWADATTYESKLAKVVAATGGRAFYSNNGLKRIVDSVVAGGSHYYTLSYTPANTAWNGAYRNIRVELANQGQKYLAGLNGSPPLQGPLHLEYRTGYFAHPPQDRVHGPQRKLLSAPVSCYHCTAAPKLSPVDQAMRFGSVAPFQLLFRVHVDPAATTERIARSQSTPASNFLQPNWLHKTYRNYTLQFSLDPNQIQFKEQDGSHVAAVQFLTVLYDENGRLVNSLVTRADISFNKDQYLAATRNGLSLHQTVAVPAKGEYWLRVGVTDLASGRVGALELPVSQVELPSQQTAANAAASPHR